MRDSGSGLVEWGSAYVPPSANYEVARARLNQAPVDTTAEGVKATRIPERYDQLPELGVRQAAIAAAEGAMRHGEDNWRRGTDPALHLNHALAHIFAYLAGQKCGNATVEDHLGHAAWRILAASHLDQLGYKLVLHE